MNLKAPKLLTNALRPGKRLWTVQCKVSGPGAYMLTEALVYIGVLFVLLGVGYAALYRCIENSVALRRNAEEIANALHAGERWRADLRLANGQVEWENRSAEHILRLPTARGELAYRFATNSVFRQVGNGPWTHLLQNVKSSVMEPDQRQTLTAWRWELEIQHRGKSTRVRPLFTFIAVPPASSTK